MQEGFESFSRIVNKCQIKTRGASGAGMCWHRRRAEGLDKNHQLFLILIWSGEQAGLFHRGQVDEEFGSA